ncbi:MAG: Uma2 family endonuclease [Methylobacter sp.]
MNWSSICENPVLANLPYKIQTDKWGNIVMSPATNRHGIYQAKIVALLSRMMHTGTVITECSVETHEGTKVADVAWASDQFIQTNQDMTPFIEAPEICVEIISPSNTNAEMDEKKELYFARGCKEFWLCDSDGNMKFYKNTGELERSLIFNEFPDRVEMH